MSLTMTQIKEICDYVYNQATTYDVYTSNSNPMRLYYITVTGQGAKVYKKGEDIVTIFGKRNLPYTDDEEIKSYTADVVYNSLAPTATQEKVNFRGVGANISVKTLIRNIGVFLGVKIAANIDKVNPTMYNEMVEICRSHVDNVNKIPYFLAKDEHNGIKYQSFVPLDILVDIAVYLNNSGIFTQEREIINPGVYYKYDKINSQETYDLYKDYVKSISELYPDNYDKDTFYDKLYNYFSYNRSQIEQQGLRNSIDAFIAAFDTLVNYDNILMFNIGFSSTVDQDQNINHLTNILVREFPKSCYAAIGAGDVNRLKIFRNGSDGSYYGSSTYFMYFNNTEDFQYINYTINYNLEQQKITQSYNVYEKTKDTYYSIQNINSRDWFCNVKFTDNLKCFCTEINLGHTIIGSQDRYALPLDYYGNLIANTMYERDVLKLCGLTPFYMDNAIKAELIKSTITDLDLENDLLILTNGINNKSYLFRFKNLKSLKANFTGLGRPYGVYTLYQAERPEHGNWVYQNRVMDYCIYSSLYSITLTNNTFNFLEDTEIERYKIDNTNYTMELVSSITTQTYVFPKSEDSYDLTYSYSNLGSIVQHEVIDTYSGIELESGANYPTTVVDEQSFISYYSNRLYNYVGNPNIEDEEIVNNKVDTIFVNCSVSETPPASQSDSVNWDIDDATPEDQEKIADDVDSSANDKDEEDEEDDPLSDDETKPSENEGDSTIPTIDDVFKYNMSQFQTQWVLNDAEFQSLGLLINSSDFLTAIAMKIAGILGIDPLSGIVSVQVAPISLTPNIDTTLKTMVIRGIEMTGDVKFLDTGTRTVTVQGYTLTENVKEFDLGEKDISPYFNSYTDLVDTQMTLYLPFIGNIDLDIRDFYDGSIWIKGFVESFTGQIVYYIIAKKENQTRIISTVTGNCYSTIPLNQDSYGSIMNSFTRG